MANDIEIKIKKETQKNFIQKIFKYIDIQKK